MLYPRQINKDIKKYLEVGEEFIILTGARQTGKTSILVMLKEYLEEKGHNCHYFNLENPEYLGSFDQHPFNLFEYLEEKRSKQYVFLDEIQYLSDPANFLKLLYDEKREDIKIIATGSSSFYIDRKFKDSLAGRKFLFEVFPLNFREYLDFKGYSDLGVGKLKTKDLRKLEELWSEYIVYGGYPKVALAEEADLKRIYLEEIGSSYIKKDIKEAGIGNEAKYFSLMKIMASQTGTLVNMSELADTLNLAVKTVEEYFYIMTKSYHVALIRPFFKNVRKELTKMPKAYFFDPGLRNFFRNDFTKIEKREDKGEYLENIFFLYLLEKDGSADRINFWRTQDQKEVDFITEDAAYEIKFDSKRSKPDKYKKFTDNYPEKKLEIITYDKCKEFFFNM
ncbi:MAG TPA: ATP-binding protein [Patescibacteria group bacterium]|nr:ATP-binding protein [Patescibacteria group bacterium]